MTFTVIGMYFYNRLRVETNNKNIDRKRLEIKRVQRFGRLKIAPTRNELLINTIRDSCKPLYVLLLMVACRGDF